MDKFIVKKPRQNSEINIENEMNNNNLNQQQDKKNTECSRTLLDAGKSPHSFKKWQQVYPWLVLNSNGKSVCAVCTEATRKKLPLAKCSRAASSREAFVTTGFDCWKNATLSFKKHESGELHRSAAEALANTKKESIVQCLSESKFREMKDARHALEKVFSTVIMLGRQGLALRGRNNDEQSNLVQFLKLRAEDVPELKTWLNRSVKWLHHDSIDEILKIAANEIRRVLLRRIKSTAYYALIIDETSDVSTLEQVSISIRIVLNDLTVEENWMGFYETSSTTSATLFDIVRDTLCRFDLDVENLRGQCYDGAANVSGHLSGLQARIRQLEPRALYVHCTAHSLNLVVQDAMEKVACAKNVIGIIKELICFIRDSPKRLAAFKNLQAKDTPNLSPFCPTRWCMRIKSLKTVHSKENYEAILEFLDNMRSDSTTNSTVAAKATGLLKQLEGFDFYYLLSTMIIILERIETLNAQLQKYELSVNESHDKVQAVRDSLVEMRKSGFESSWSKTIAGAQDLNLEEPAVPRIRKARNQLLKSSVNNQHIFSTSEEYYRKTFYEILDQVIGSLANRFCSETTKILNEFEDFVTGKNGVEVETVATFYTRKSNDGDCDSARVSRDFDAERLVLHRDMFLDIVSGRKQKVENLKDVVLFLKSNPSICDLVPEFTKLVKILLTVPASSCTAERSFSALRRLKNYMRSSMTQKRLNDIAILHIHSDISDSVDQEKLVDEFVCANHIRKATFAMRSQANLKHRKN